MKNKFILPIVLGALALGVRPLYSFADGGHSWGQHGGHSYYHYHDHPRYGLHVGMFYPDEYYPVWTGGAQYYYDDGIYYNYAGGAYVVASPPLGAVVSTVPSDFQPVIINGVTYYTDNGTYYVHTPNGYKVVSPPSQNPQLRTMYGK